MKKKNHSVVRRDLRGCPTGRRKIILSSAGISEGGLREEEKLHRRPQKAPTQEKFSGNSSAGAKKIGIRSSIFTFHRPLRLQKQADESNTNLFQV